MSKLLKRIKCFFTGHQETEIYFGQFMSAYACRKCKRVKLEQTGS